MTALRSAGTICFDATGTLVEMTEPVGEVYRRVAQQHGVDLPAWRLEDAFRRVLRHAPTRGIEGESVDEREANEIEWWFERIRQTFQATDSTVRFEDFRGFAQALFDHYASPAAWRARPGIPDLLSRLRRADCFLAVISNFDHRLPKLLEALDLAELFDLIEIPSIAGRSKPDRSIFEAIAEAAGRGVESLTYVGDDPPEILGTISEYGLAVIDVRATPDPDTLADLLRPASNPQPAATLPTTAQAAKS